MWRRLLRGCHPDGAGDEPLFVWVRELQQYVAGDDVEPPRRENEPPRRTTTQESPRIDYAAAFDKAGSFDELTRQAVALVEQVPEPYASVLKLLEDCHEVPEVAGTVYRQQHAGATYKSLATIGHRVGMDKAARIQWYGSPSPCLSASAMRGTSWLRGCGAGGSSVSTQTARQTTLPTTWLGRTLRLQYVDAFGEGMETSGTLLDLSPVGMIVNIKGAKTLLSWDAVRVVELVED